MSAESATIERITITAPSSADAQVAGAIATTRQEPTSDTKFNTLDELKQKAPEVYQKMMEGIAMDICREMQRHQDDIKKINREAKRH